MKDHRLRCGDQVINDTHCLVSHSLVGRTQDSGCLVLGDL
jgi:hypothetical protein